MTKERFDYVICPKCGHDKNTSAMKKCEICGTTLNGKKGIPTAAIAGAAAITLGIVGFAGYSFLNPSSKLQTGNSSGGKKPTQPPRLPPSTTVTLLSEGERILFKRSTDEDKTAGSISYGKGDYEQAISLFTASRKRRRNDPETLIYLNNAKVRDREAVYIAAAVPAGKNPNSAQEILRGVAQIQQLHNDSGNGLPLKVVIADDSNNRTQAQNVAEALVADDRIRMVVGHGTSTTTLAGAKIYQAEGLPMIAPTSTSTELTTLPRSDTNFIYRTIPSDQFAGTLLARHVLKKMDKKSATVFFNSDSTYSRSIKQAFTTTFGLEGGTITKEIDFANGDSTALMAQVNAEVVALFPDSKTFDDALEVVLANNKRLPLIAGDAMYTLNALKRAGTALEGTTLAIPWHPASSAEPNFVSSSMKLWGGDVNWRTALSYDVMKTLETALSSAETSREALAKTISSKDFKAKGVTGEIRFSPTGDRNGSLVLVQVKPGNRSKTGYDFVPIQ